MPSCCIKQCGARKNKNQPNLTLHRFPRNENLKKKWIEAIGSEKINPRHKMWHICSKHFDKSCFNRTLDVIRLRDGAVPTSTLDSSLPTIDPTTAGSGRSLPTPEMRARCGSSQAAQSASECRAVSSRQSSQQPTSSKMILNKINIVILREKQNKSEEDPLKLELLDDNFTENVPSAKIQQQNEKIMYLTKKCNMLKQKVRSLNEKIRRRDGKIALFSNIIQDLKKGD